MDFNIASLPPTRNEIDSALSASTKKAKTMFFTRLSILILLVVGLCAAALPAVGQLSIGLMVFPIFMAAIFSIPSAPFTKMDILSFLIPPLAAALSYFVWYRFSPGLFVSGGVFPLFVTFVGAIAGLVLNGIPAVHHQRAVDLIKSLSTAPKKSCLSIKRSMVVPAVKSYMAHPVMRTRQPTLGEVVAMHKLWLEHHENFHQQEIDAACREINMVPLVGQ